MVRFQLFFFLHSACLIMEKKCAVLMELQDPHFFQSLSNPLRLTDQKFLISAVNGKKNKENFY